MQSKLPITRGRAFFATFLADLRFPILRQVSSGAATGGCSRSVGGDLGPSRGAGVGSCHAGMAGIETNEQKRSFRCLIDHARGLRLPTHKAMESRSYESSDGTDHSHGYEEVCEPTQWCSRASRVRAAGAG